MVTDVRINEGGFSVSKRENIGHHEGDKMGMHNSEGGDRCNENAEKHSS